MYGKKDSGGFGGFNVIFVAVATLIIIAGLSLLINSFSRSFSSVDVTGDITVGGTVDGKDVGGTHSKQISLDSDVFGRPVVNPPNIVNQDNVQLLSFTVDTDKVFYKFPIPHDYASGDIVFSVVWTNDGGTDDDGLAVKWQLDYQTASEGDQVNDSHTNSPKSVEDTYSGAIGWIEHHSANMVIGTADFSGKACIFLKLSAVTPTGSDLTCEPHLIGVCFTYTAHNIVNN